MSALLGTAGGLRSPRVWNHVQNVTEVRPMDVLSFLGEDASWHEGIVHSRAASCGLVAAWWVTVSRWDGNDVRRKCILVERMASGSLAEVADHDHAPPVVYLS